MEKTPQGHRRIRGCHKGNFTLSMLCISKNNESSPNFPVQHQSTVTNKNQENHVACKMENRSAYIPFPTPVTESLKLAGDSKSAFSSTHPQSSCSMQQPVYSLGAVPPIAVDLHVTNLDQSIGAKEMKTLITSVFKQHVMVKLS